jgi:hypothetical protein
MAITLKNLSDSLGFRTWQALDALDEAGYPARRGESVLSPEEEQVVREWDKSRKNPIQTIDAGDLLRCVRCNHTSEVEDVFSQLQKIDNRIKDGINSVMQFYRVPKDVLSRLRCARCGTSNPLIEIGPNSFSGRSSFADPPEDFGEIEYRREVDEIRRECFADADSYAESNCGGGWFYSDEE